MVRRRHARMIIVWTMDAAVNADKIGRHKLQGITLTEGTAIPRQPPGQDLPGQPEDPDPTDINLTGIWLAHGYECYNRLSPPGRSKSSGGASTASRRWPPR